MPCAAQRLDESALGAQDDSSPAGPPRRLLPWAAMCVALLSMAWLYSALAVALWHAWQVDPNYSHGPLLLAVAIGLAIRAHWRRSQSNESPLSESLSRATHNVEPSGPVSSRDFGAGMATVAIALTLHGVAWLLNFTLLDAVSLVGAILGLLLALGGRGVRRDFGFPVLLLLLAVPLPVAWYQPLALAMQQFVSGAASAVFAVCGLSVYREGYIVHLTGLAMEVGAACSGLRQLTAFIALGAILAHLAGRGRRYGGLLIIAAMLTAVLANLLRVLVTGLILVTAGPTWAAGVFHTLEGVLTLALGAALLLALAVGLARWQDHWTKRAGGADADGFGPITRDKAFASASHAGGIAR